MKTFDCLRAAFLGLTSVILLPIWPMLIAADADQRFRSPISSIGGEAAVAALKGEGTYESLRVAVETAQHRILPVSPGSEKVHEAINPSQKIRARFHKRGGSFVTPACTTSKEGINLKLSTYGYGKDLKTMAEPQLVVEGNRSENRWDGITEWYVNKPAGIEHGFTVDEPPLAGEVSLAGEREPEMIRNERTAKLTFVMQVEGALIPKLSEDGTSILFYSKASGSQGVPTLRYSKLHVTDALQQKLPAKLAVRNENEIAIEVDDHGAAYPIVVDPIFTSGASLPLPDHGLRLGLLSISGDTAVVAGQDSDGVSAVYIFVQFGEEWILQQKLTNPDPSAAVSLGSEVAIRGDTLVVSAYTPTEAGANAFAGFAHVYTRAGDVWSLRKTLGPTDIEQYQNPKWGLSGAAVAISGNAESIAILASSDLEAGVYIFEEHNGVWSQQAKLTSDVDSFGSAGYWGTSLAIDGNTVIAGAPYSSYPEYTGYYSGAAVAFVRTGATWAQHERQIIRPGDQYGQPDTSRFNGHYFGQGIALRGKTAVIGGSWAYVFVQGEDGVWREQQKLGRHHSDWTIETSVDETEAIIATGSPYEGVSVYLRDGNQWVKEHTYTFGSGLLVASVGMSDGTMTVGAEPEISPSPYRQSAFTFRVSNRISKLTPTSCPSGSGSFNLTVDGFSFSQGAVVQWKAPQMETPVALETTFVGSTQLTAAVPASLIPSTSDLYTVIVTVMAPDGRVSSPAVFLVTAANVALAESGVAGPGQSVIVSTAPIVPDPETPQTSTNTVGITATLVNRDGSENQNAVTVSAAIYNSNPAPEKPAFAIESATGITGQFMDLQVTGADAADTMTAYFYYPPDALETETAPILKYFNISTQQWTLVLNSIAGPGVTPEKSPINNLDATVSGGRFTVHFDNTSTPKITELGGTFFAIAVPRPPLSFNGFFAPIGGADTSGGSFDNPVRTFKAGSTIPVKFTASRDGTAIVTGVHTLKATKYSSGTTAATPIDATPQGKATTGSQFVLKDGEWHFKLDTKATGLTAGVWQLTATLSDGSQHRVWIQIK